MVDFNSEDDKYKQFKEYNNKGEEFLDNFNPSEAIHWFNKALELYPNDFDALSSKLSCETLLNRWSDVIETADLILKLVVDDNDKGTTLSFKGVGFVKLSDYDNAIKQFDESIKLKPDDFSNYEYKANALEELKKYDDALECYDKAIELLKTDDRINYYGEDVKTKLNYIESSRNNCLLKKSDNEILDHIAEVVEPVNSDADATIYDIKTDSVGFCFRCGSKLVSDDILFCSTCGQKLDEPIEVNINSEIKELVEKLNRLSYTYEEIMQIIVLSEYYKAYWRKEQRNIMQTLEIYRYDVELIGHTLAFGEKNNLSWKEVSKLISNSYSPEDLDKQREEQLKALQSISNDLEELDDDIRYLGSSINSSISALNSDLNNSLSSINSKVGLINDTVSRDFFFTHMWNGGKL